MIYRVFTLFLLCVLIASVMFGCADEMVEAPSPKRIALALGRGGLGDRSFNDSAYKGLQKAKDELDILFQIADLQEATDAEASLRELSQGEYDLIIVLGLEYQTALEEVAADFPDQSYAIVDAVVDAPNVTSVIFRELEGDFLAGALTALMSSSQTVGFVGGADTESIRRIEYGWREGVNYINPDIKILSKYLTGPNDFSGFSRTDLGSQAAEQMFDEQADVLYLAAGRASLGGIDRASKTDKLVITTGDDQRWIDPSVITSRVKRMDQAVWNLASALVNDQLQPGVITLDFFSEGIQLAPLDNPRIPEEVRQQMQQLQQGLIDGTIVLQPYKP